MNKNLHLAAAKPLIDNVVSLAWKGYGSALFLEVGEMIDEKGIHTIFVGYNWRIESPKKVLLSGYYSGPRIEKLIKNLEGVKIEKVETLLPYHELAITFSNDLTLRSLQLGQDPPDWYVRFQSEKYLSVKRGEITLDDGSKVCSDEEIDEIDSYEDVVSRWGKPKSGEDKGVCYNCNHFIRLDGNYHLLDYGVCIHEMSPFDGRVTNRNSHCEKFEAEVDDDL